MATTVIGALQAVVLVAVIGSGYETDAFLAAYALYYALVIVAASVRAPFVSRLGSIDSAPELVKVSRDLLTRGLTVSIALGLLLLAVAPIAGYLVTHAGGWRSQQIAIFSLLILVPAGAMQLFATSAAAVLNSARRFEFSALLYGVSSLISIVAAFALLETIGILGAPLGMLVGALALAVGHAFYLRRFDVKATISGAVVRDAPTRRIAYEVIANSSLGMSIQLGLAVALAVVGTLGREGLVTDYSYGYFLVLAMTGFTSVALNTVILPDVVREAARHGLAGARDRIIAVAPFTLGVLVLVIAALFTFGRPLLEWAAAPLLPAEEIDVVYTVATVFSVAALGQMLLHNGSTAVISMQRWGIMMGAAAVAFGLQCIAVIAVSGTDVSTIAWAHSLALLASAVVLFSALFKGQAPIVLLQSLKPVLRLAPCAVAFPVCLLLLGSDPTPAVAIAGLVGSTLVYILLAAALNPQLRTGFSALRGARPAID
ncbi:MAG: lipid II flippase MurJ [Solirubrobacterales bacterium]